MGAENIEEFEAAMAGTEALEEWLNRNSPSAFGVTADDVIASMGQLLSEVDKAALTGELAESIAESFRRAGQQGIVGWRDDDLTLIRPWGFDVTAIEVPVSVWQGAQDRMVPYAHGTWLAEHIPGARAHLYHDEGHISLIMQMDRILDDLLDCAGLTGQTASS
jgi:pimeloyl-ACP methyl ester carboxylesterase